MDDDYRKLLRQLRPYPRLRRRLILEDIGYSLAALAIIAAVMLLAIAFDVYVIRTR